MDWGEIIKTLLTVGGTIAVAWITYGVKKSTSESNSEVLARIDGLEKISNDNNVKIEKIQQTLVSQESTNLIQQTQLNKINKDLDDNNLRTLRLDLLHAIETDPNNQLVILELAQKYFVEMKGNCYMSKVFQEWADDHHVNITSIFNKD